ARVRWDRPRPGPPPRRTVHRTGRPFPFPPRAAPGMPASTTAREVTTIRSATLDPVMSRSGVERRRSRGVVVEQRANGGDACRGHAAALPDPARHAPRAPELSAGAADQAVEARAGCAAPAPQERPGAADPPRKVAGHALPAARQGFGPGADAGEGIEAVDADGRASMRPVAGRSRAGVVGRTAVGVGAAAARDGGVHAAGGRVTPVTG